MKRISIFTDGSCSPNPGAGGWGALLYLDGDRPVELSGAEADTTNNRMELTAVVRSLEQVPPETPVRIVTDSQYLSKAFTHHWLKNWVRNGWRTAAKKPVKNHDLWKKLLELTRDRDCEWVWVRGHNDHPENERCDQLANNAREKLGER